MSNLRTEKPNSLIDSPIVTSAEDELDRSKVAHYFADSLRELDASQGLVVGILGPWGHGKSSFINLMKEQFELEPTLTVIDFNPWMYSGSEELVNFFFNEITAELKISSNNQFAKVADWIAKYASILKPVSQLIPIAGAGLLGETVANAVQGVADTTNANLSASKLRAEISAELSKVEQPIVVVIDDIDRLSRNEIREIFKLVRLTANFPNIVYLLAFDRKIVEAALADYVISGRDYLEKIVQLSFDVPKISQLLLRTRVFSELDGIIAPVAKPVLDESRWRDVYWEILDPLFSNIRDVKRFATSCRATVQHLATEIDLVDLLAMEAIRVFRPELFHKLSDLRVELTSTRGLMSNNDDRKQKAIDRVLEQSPDDIILIRALFNRIFPSALRYIENNVYGDNWLKDWRLAHRMAHVDFLNMYFDQVAPSELRAFRDSEKAFTLLINAQELKSYLNSLKSELLEAVIEGLTTYEDRFSPEMVVPATTVLLNLIDEIPVTEQSGFFDISRPDMTVGRVVVRLLRRVEEESVREEFVSQILGQLETYSSQLHLLNLVGNQAGIGQNLVSNEFVESTEQNFVNRLHSVPPQQPSREWDAWRIYNKVHEALNVSPLSSEQNPILLKMVLKSAKTTSRSQSLDSRLVITEEHFAWEILTKLFGSDFEIQNAVNAIRDSLGDDELLQLADKYLSGWRPNNTFSSNSAT